MTRVLVTGGTGVVGSAVCGELLRIGVEPIAYARTTPRGLLDGIEFVAGDVAETDKLAEVMADCDAVIHLAWETRRDAGSHQLEKTNIAGTTSVISAMKQADCRRIVFLSSTALYGSSKDHQTPFTEDQPAASLKSFVATQKGEAERLINDEAELDVVIARAPLVLGRGVDSESSRAYAGRAIPDIDGRSVIQAVHREDAARFLAEASLGVQTGTVNLAANGSISIADAGKLLGRRVRNVPRAIAGQVGPLLGFPGFDSSQIEMMAGWPVADTSALQTQWSFAPVWSHEELFRDHGRATSASTFTGSNSTPRRHKRSMPWLASNLLPREAYLPDVDWQPAADPEFVGSFDTLIDPEMPVYSDANVGEAFPGPLTPLTLEFTENAMSVTADGIMDLLGLDGDLADAMRIGSGFYGHHIYMNLSAIHQMTKVLPGPDAQEDFDRMYLGVEDAPESEPQRMSAKDAASAARIGSRVAPRLAGYGAAVEGTASEAKRLFDVDVTTLNEPQLVSHLRLAHDLVCQAWAVTGTGNILLTGFANILEDDTSEESNSAGATTTLRINDLAALIRSDADLAEALGDETTTPTLLRSVVADFPALETMVESVIEECGHRGVGECELENLVFSDQPENLVDIARRAAQLPAPESRSAQRKRSRSERFARNVLENKENARNNVVRTLHAARIAIRERGQRWHDEGLLSDPNDVFYLAYHELLRPAPVAQAVITERRAERERLSGYQMPHTFERQWAPISSSTPTGEVGEVMTGVGAVAGVYEGVARVMQDPMEAFDPGDVLVCKVTDIGWTSLFPIAGAVVTDVGGAASHAAIVAREFGLPAVVGVGDATVRIQPGMIVRVNGDDGTVEVTRRDN